MKTKTASAFSVLGVVAVSGVAVAINTQIASIDANASANSVKLAGIGAVSVKHVVPTPTITIYRTAKPQPVVTTKTYAKSPVQVQAPATVTKSTYKSHSTSGGSKGLSTAESSDDTEQEGSDD